MMPNPDDLIETRIRHLAASFPYPETPDLYSRLETREIALRKPVRGRFATAARYALVALLVLFAIAMLVPTVRAAVLEFLQIGGIRINLQTPTPVGTPIPGALEQPAGPPATATPLPALFSEMDLAGETSLDQAVQAWGDSILLPDPAGELGPPDRVYLQRRNGLILLLVWLAPGEPDKPSASLILLQPGAFLSKSQPESYQQVEVRGQQGLWLQGRHVLYLEVGGKYPGESNVWVTGNVLIWEEAGITYRLESSLDLDQAQAIAESLQPYP